MEKETFCWITMSYAGVFEDLKIKNNEAEKNNLTNSLHFKKGEEKEANHLLHLIQALIKANYSGAKNWYKNLPKEYVELIPRLKIEQPETYD